MAVTVCACMCSQLVKAGFSGIVCTTYDCFTLGLSVASSYYTRSQENKVTSSVEHAHTQLCWSLENSKKVSDRQTLHALTIIMDMRKSFKQLSSQTLVPSNRVTVERLKVIKAASTYFITGY